MEQARGGTIQRNPLQTAVLLLGTLGGVAYWALPYSPMSELLLYDGVVALALVASLAGLRRVARAGARRLPWVMASLSLAGFLAGELIWWWYQARGLDPFPSVADAAYLSSYLPLAVAAATLASAEARDRDRSVWLDAGILTIVAGLIVWIAVIGPYARDPTLGWLEKGVTLAYPLADIMVIGLALRLVLSRSARTRARLLFGAGLIVMFAADVTFGRLELVGAYRPSSALDTAWALSYVLIGAAALDRSAAWSPPPVEDSDSGRGRLAVVLLAVLVPQGVLVYGLQLGVAVLATATIAACAATAAFTLMAIRMWALLGRARRLEARRGSERLSAVIHHSSDAIFLIDPDAVIGYASPAVGTLWGYEPEGAVGRSLLDLSVDDDRAGASRRLGDIAAAPAGTIAAIEGRLLSAAGQVCLFEGTARNLLSDPSVGATVVTVRDVTGRRRMEAQLERQAFHDELTGLANRTLFADRVAHALERSSRHPGANIAVLFLDLDDFKAVNDGMGHSAGDALLREVANRIRICTRPADTVARLGGDEFAILVEDLPSLDFAHRLAERILEMLRLPLPVLDVDLAVLASIGVAPRSPDSTVESLLRDADIAMYSAKAKGKGRIEVFDDAQRQVAEHHLALKIDLPRAMREGEIRLVYQPICHVGSGELSGFEALARWEHPQRGNVPPLEFIPAAEESGLIVELGRWILGEACRQAVSWNKRSDRPLVMNVNVSAAQLHQPGFLAIVEETLTATGLPASLLTIELTESVIADHGRVEPLLAVLRDLGVGIAIDDFGTGYSSLSYLQRFPVTSVKVDQSFIAELARDGNPGLVRSILAIADALALKTVAEGVETPGQLELLESLDCGHAQGYYLGRPGEAAAIDELLSQPRALPSLRDEDAGQAQLSA